MCNIFLPPNDTWQMTSTGKSKDDADGASRWSPRLCHGLDCFGDIFFSTLCIDCRLVLDFMRHQRLLLATTRTFNSCSLLLQAAVSQYRFTTHKFCAETQKKLCQSWKDPAVVTKFPSHRWNQRLTRLDYIHNAVIRISSAVTTMLSGLHLGAPLMQAMHMSSLFAWRCSSY